MTEGGGIGGFGGGWLQHPRRWLGAQWPGLWLRVSTRNRQARPEEAHASSYGTAKTTR